MITLKMIKAIVDLADKYNFPLESTVNWFRPDGFYITNKDTNDSITLDRRNDGSITIQRTEVEQVFKD